MGTLDGRVAAITGAGRGIGREHALLFAREGASVIVSDLGDAAQDVVDEIRAFGGEAVAARTDVADFDAAGALVQTAVNAFGQLDVLVCNAGILADAFLPSMTEEQFDDVMRVHLKGHWAPMRHAAAHFRNRAKAGETVRGSIVCTASASGTLHPNPGQTNYGAAKAGIAALAMIAAAELNRYGVRVNAITPVARTRMSEDVPLIGDVVRAPDDPDAWDPFHPRNVAPLVAHLAREDCAITGKLFAVQGGWIAECEGWQVARQHTCDGDWTIDRVAAQLDGVPA